MSCQRYSRVPSNACQLHCLKHGNHTEYVCMVGIKCWTGSSDPLELIYPVWSLRGGGGSLYFNLSVVLLMTWLASVVLSDLSEVTVSSLGICLCM